MADESEASAAAAACDCVVVCDCCWCYWRAVVDEVAAAFDAVVVVAAGVVGGSAVVAASGGVLHSIRTWLLVVGRGGAGAGGGGGGVEFEMSCAPAAARSECAVVVAVVGCVGNWQVAGGRQQRAVQRSGDTRRAALDWTGSAAYCHCSRCRGRRAGEDLTYQREEGRRRRRMGGEWEEDSRYDVDLLIARRFHSLNLSYRLSRPP